MWQRGLFYILETSKQHAYTCENHIKVGGREAASLIESMLMNAMFARPSREIQDPPIARLLFNDTRSAWVWLVVRLWLGWEWFIHGVEKVQSPAWQTGAAIRGFWENAIKIPTEGRAPIAFDWYRDFLTFLYNTNSHTWFGPLVAWGELLVGLGLIVGAFVGVTAFFGAFLNWNFIMAGAASTNGLFLILAILLVLAWKVAGFIGADFYLLPRLGTPWKSQVEDKKPAMASPKARLS